MEVRELVKVEQGKRVSFHHISHTQNELADWLGRVAYHRWASMPHEEWCFPGLGESAPTPLLLDLPVVTQLATPA